MISTLAPEQLAALFEGLVDQWRAETLHLSSTTQIATHPAYQRIIGLGPVVIPLILKELAKKPNHWFWALRALTGEDPVAEEDQGKIEEMTAAWLSWGQEQGYLS